MIYFSFDKNTDQVVFMRPATTRSPAVILCADEAEAEEMHKHLEQFLAPRRAARASKLDETLDPPLGGQVQPPRRGR